jgi:peptidoglycan L-alanyl-D-glutamate endopeptidase CwlK
MASRRIEDLQPLLQVKAKYWLNLCEQEWPGADIEPLITNTLRTRAEQETLYAQGRTAPGKIVTWTKESPHLYGCAWDFVPLRMGKPVWDNRRPENLRLWTRMGELAEQLGLEWGGRWKKPDMPHVQLREWRHFVQ